MPVWFYWVLFKYQSKMENSQLCVVACSHSATGDLRTHHEQKNLRNSPI